jgi:type IV pilus assembly protein PilO
MAKFNLSIKMQNIPKWAKILIALAPTLIFAGIFVFMVILPKMKQADSLRQEIEKQDKEISKAQNMVARLDVLKKENNKLKDRLLLLQNQLPEEGEISSLLKQVSDLGIEAGLKIISWRPSGRRMHSSGIVYEVPVSVSFSGSFHRLGEFFASLTRLDRIVNIHNIKLSGPKIVDNVVILDIGFSAVTFTAVSEGGITSK